MNDWLIPWRDRGTSGAVTDNVLWRSERLYVMDNHRLALWCWWQHLADSALWNFLHVDRHYDALWQKFNPWPSHTSSDHRVDLEAFRRARVQCNGAMCELYRWDTITSALWSLHSNSLLEMQFATAGEGDKPEIPKANYTKPWGLPSLLRYIATPDEHLEYPYIVDIDIDYFTHHDIDNAFGQVFSEEYLLELADSLRAGYDNGRIGVITVALSPETTGSWALAEDVAAILLSRFDTFGEFRSGAP